MIVCSQCKKYVKGIKQEVLGVVLVVCNIPFFFEFNIITSAFAIIAISIGVNWIINKPSKKFVCKECAKKNI